MKIIKIILINLLVLFFLFVVFEYFLFLDNKKKSPNDEYHIGKIPYINLLRPERFRPVSGLSFSKRPVIILGCSFAYGKFLNDDETLSYKLARYTQRPVYNYAVEGKAFQNALYILENKIYDTNIKNPEYVIYVMMSDHIRRLYTNVCMADFVGYPLYVFDKNGKLYMKKPYYPVYRQFYTFYFINNWIFKKFLEKDYNRHSKYVNAYFKAMNEEIKKQYPDTKFVILMYGNNNFGLNLSELEKSGFIIINTQDITGVNLLSREYQQSDTDKHPVAKAWDIVVPALADRLKL